MLSSAEKSLFFSNQFAISCGTVSIDVAREKVLLIRWRRTGEYLLPKGRKNVGESLEHTAARETFEETGIPVKLLPVNIETMATLPAPMRGEIDHKVVTEPIAVSQRMNKGILKIMFWYVASADSTVTPVEGTQDEDEDFDTIWAGFDEFEAVLSFEDDKSIVREAIAAARRAYCQMQALEEADGLTEENVTRRGE